MNTIEHLEALRHSLQAARNVTHSPLLHKERANGLNDGLDVALNLIALEIQIAQTSAAAHQ
jgi:hypothetical protein